MLAFGLDAVSLVQFRAAIETFGIATPVRSGGDKASERYRAWILNPTLPAELDDLGEDLDTGDGDDAEPLPVPEAIEEDPPT